MSRFKQIKDSVEEKEKSLAGSKIPRGNSKNESNDNIEIDTDQEVEKYDSIADFIDQLED